MHFMRLGSDLFGYELFTRMVDYVLLLRCRFRGGDFSSPTSLFSAALAIAFVIAFAFVTFLTLIEMTWHRFSLNDHTEHDPRSGLFNGFVKYVLLSFALLIAFAIVHEFMSS